MHETIYAPDYYILEHHGILGQKWGVRRYQNSDGSLTEAGKKRYLTSDRTRFNAVGQSHYSESSERVLHPTSTKFGTAILGGVVGAQASSAATMLAISAGLISAYSMPIAGIAATAGAGAITGYLYGKYRVGTDTAFVEKNERYDNAKDIRAR